MATLMVRAVVLAIWICSAGCAAVPLGGPERKPAVIDDQEMTEDNAAKYISDLLWRSLVPTEDPEMLTKALGGTGFETLTHPDGSMRGYRFFLDPRYIEHAWSGVSYKNPDSFRTINGLALEVKPGARLHVNDFVIFLGDFKKQVAQLYLPYSVTFHDIIVPWSHYRGVVEMHLSDAPENPEAVVTFVNIMRDDRPRPGEARK
jgi:hypothetical protein